MTPAAAAANLRKLSFLVDNAVHTAMVRALVKARRGAVEDHMEPQSWTAPVHPTKLTHRTRTLGRSVKVDRPRKVPGGWLGKLFAGGLNIRYAAVHEITGVGKAPKVKRPFLKPAVDDVLPFMRKEMARLMGVAIKQAGL